MQGENSKSLPEDGRGGRRAPRRQCLLYLPITDCCKEQRLTKSLLGGEGVGGLSMRAFWWLLTRDTQAVLNGIEAGRNIMSQCWFDEKRCARGLSALEGYQAEYDEKAKRLADHPAHTWCSHGADAFRTFAVGFRIREKNVPVTSIMNGITMGGKW